VIAAVAELRKLESGFARRILSLTEALSVEIVAFHEMRVKFGKLQEETHARIPIVLMEIPRIATYFKQGLAVANYTDQEVIK
jgi:hypothetical protein